MSTTGASADPLAVLGELPGVGDAVDSVRRSVDRVYGHRVMRRRGPEVASEAALRGARASAALSGADWALEEVRRRTDFRGADAADPARTVGAALRLTAEAGQLLSIWRQSPLRVLARLHLLAAAGREAASGRGEGREAASGRGEGREAASGRGEARGETGSERGGARGETGSGRGTDAVVGQGEDVGRPRRAGEGVDEDLGGLSLPDAEEVAVRLDGLSGLIVAGGAAPALVTAAVVHGELLALRPFTSHNGAVARAAQRVVLTGSGLDPKAVCPAEVGHQEQGRDAYLTALKGYVSGTPEGVASWIAHCGRAVELGARESAAVCEALQRGAA